MAIGAGCLGLVDLIVVCTGMFFGFNVVVDVIACACVWESVIMMMMMVAVVGDDGDGIWMELESGGGTDL